MKKTILILPFAALMALSSCVNGDSTTTSEDYGSAIIYEDGDIDDDYWQHDETHHWHEEEDGTKSGLAEHVWATLPEEELDYGYVVKHYICTHCQRKKTERVEDEETCHIRFISDGEVIYESDVKRGTTATLPLDVDLPSIETRYGYAYSFKAWEPALGKVTEDVDYVATFDEYQVYYTVTWTNYDGTVLAIEQNKYHYGDTPKVPESASNPTKPSSYGATYSFSGWEPEIGPIKDDTVYQAVYEATKGQDLLNYEYDSSLSGYVVTGISSGNSFETVDIPAVHDNRQVVAIKDRAFYGDQMIRFLNIGGGIRTIGVDAFGNSVLESVTMRQGISSIEKDAFRNSNLKSIIIPTSVKSIGASAFAHCQNLVSANINGAEEIGSSAFAQCPELKTVSMPDNLKTIGSNAFDGDKKLETVSFGPDSNAKIGSLAFNECSNLRNVYGGLYSIRDVESYAFSECRYLANFPSFPNLRAIGDYAFQNCISYDKADGIDVSNATAIGRGAFEGWNQLRKYKASFIGQSAASGYDYIHYIFGAAKRPTYDDVFLPWYPAALQEIEIVGTPNKLAESALFGMQNVKKITLPATIESVGISAFNQCVKLDSVYGGLGIKRIERMAFWACHKLQYLELRDIEKIMPKAFGYAGINSDYINREHKPLLTIRYFNTRDYFLNNVFVSGTAFESAGNVFLRSNKENIFLHRDESL